MVINLLVLDGLKSLHNMITSVSLLDKQNKSQLSNIIIIFLPPAVKVNSYDIDRYPAKPVQQGHNVSITCAKTPGSISEWKLSIPKQSDSLEVLYANSANFTKDANLCLEEGAVDEVTGMQNFSITLTNVHVNMSGTAIECGARQSGMSIAQTQFHHQAAILIVHREQGKHCV